MVGYEGRGFWPQERKGDGVAEPRKALSRSKGSNHAREVELEPRLSHNRLLEREFASVHFDLSFQ